MIKNLEAAGALKNFGAVFKALSAAAEYLKDRWTILRCRYYDFKYRKYYESPEFLKKLDEAIQECKSPDAKVYDNVEEMLAEILAEPDDEDE